MSAGLHPLVRGGGLHRGVARVRQLALRRLQRGVRGDRLQPQGRHLRAALDKRRRVGRLLLLGVGAARHRHLRRARAHARRARAETRAVARMSPRGIRQKAHVTLLEYIPVNSGTDPAEIISRIPFPISHSPPPV